MNKAAKNRKTPTPHDYAWDWEGKLPKIPVTLGHGLKWKNTETKLAMVSVVGEHRYHEGKRIADLELSSWKGVSIGAMHHYARIKVSGPYYREIKTGREWSGSSYGGPDEHLARLDIEVRRRLTKVEKDMDGTPLGKIGELTYRFDTEAEAKAQAIKTFQERFAPGWVLRGHDEHGEYEYVATT